MSFSDHKITQFTHRISELADQPNMPADELKARFDACPEELRQSVNGICDDAQTLSNKVDGLVIETFEGVIEKSMLSESLADELDAKATQTALAAEQTARESADSSLGSRLSTAESTITTHTSQIAQKCQIYYGTYTGDGASSRDISLGFTPKAVLTVRDGCMFSDTYGTAALALNGTPAYIANGSGTFTALTILSNGFRVYYTNGQTDIQTNRSGTRYIYLAFR